MKATRTGFAVYFVDGRAFGLVGAYDQAKAAREAAKAVSKDHLDYVHIVVADGRIIAGYERGRRLTDAGVLAA